MDPILDNIRSTYIRDAGLHSELKAYLNSEDWTSIARYFVNPLNYNCPERYFLDNSLVTLVKKCDGLVKVDDLHSKAVETFYECERRCAATNAFLHKFATFGPFNDHSELALFDFLVKWRKNVRCILGKLPDSISPRFSSGSTFRDKGLLTTLPDKLTNNPAGTAQAVELWKMLPNDAWKQDVEVVSPRAMEVVPGNRFTSVPKDSFKRRGICVEPIINIALQLDVGAYIKRRLLREGIDLYDGETTHRECAREGSKTGELATIDLSNASDTIAKTLVKLVVPEDWYSLLSSLRSPSTIIDGKKVHLEKFSSMGNGFTFELETLLFYSLAKTLGIEAFCYGDDIIVPTDRASEMMNALSIFGFEINVKKTFTTGPFKESCGGDFFYGVDVRGPYIKEFPREPQDFIRIHNAVKKRCSTRERTLFFQPLLQFCLDSVPSSIRKCVGPESLGDIVFHDDFEHLVFYKKTRWKKPLEDSRIETPHVKAYVPVQRSLPWDHWRPNIVLISAILGQRSSGVQPRDSISGYRVVNVEIKD